MGDGGLAEAPKALRDRTAIVTLSDQSIVRVQRWSATKMFEVVDLLADVQQQIADTIAGKKGSFIKVLVEVLGPKVFTFVQLCVAPEDRARITPEMDALDLADVLEAALEVNDWERLVKKARSLGAKFAPLYRQGT